MRKSKETKIEQLKALAKLQEIEKVALQAEEDEKKLLERIENEINELCDQNGLFWGVIISPDDMSGIVKLMVQEKENVKIKGKLYFTDNE